MKKAFKRGMTVAFTMIIALVILLATGVNQGNVNAARAVDMSEYDPRPEGVSPIRDQYWGTCWAQSGIAALESYLIHNALEDNTYQLSVEDVLWWAKDFGQGGWIMQFEIGKNRIENVRDDTISGLVAFILLVILGIGLILNARVFEKKDEI